MSLRVQAKRTGTSGLVMAETMQTLVGRAGDADIACRIAGAGAADLVFALGWMSHLGVSRKWPEYARLLEPSAGHGRLLLFGQTRRRASGPSPGPALEEQADHMAAVMDAAGPGSAAMFAAARPSARLREDFANVGRRQLDHGGRSIDAPHTAFQTCCMERARRALAASFRSRCRKGRRGSGRHYLARIWGI